MANPSNIHTDDNVKAYLLNAIDVATFVVAMRSEPLVVFAGAEPVELPPTPLMI